MTAEQNRPSKAIKTSQRVVLPDGTEGIVTGVALGGDGEPLVRVRAVKATDALLNWFRDVSANGRSRGIQFSSSEPDNMIRAAEREGWIERRPNYPSGVTNPQYDITAKGRNALKQQSMRSVKSGDVSVLAARSVKARPYDDAWGRQIMDLIDRKLGYEFAWDNSDGTFTVGYLYMNPGEVGLKPAQQAQQAMVRKVQQVFPGARVRYEKIETAVPESARYYRIQVRFAPRRQAGKAAKADDSQLVAQQVAALTSLLREIARAGVTLRDAKPRQMASLYKSWRVKWNQAVTPRSSLRDARSWVYAAAAFEALSGAGNIPNMDTEQHRRIVAGVVDKLGQLVKDAKQALAAGKAVKGMRIGARVEVTAGNFAGEQGHVVGFSGKYVMVALDRQPSKPRGFSPAMLKQVFAGVRSVKAPSTNVNGVTVKNELGFIPHRDKSGDWFFDIDRTEHRIYGTYAVALQKAVTIAKRDMVDEITVTGLRPDYGQ